MTVFITLTPARAVYYRNQTKGEGAQLNPVAVRAGPYLGKELLPLSVLSDMPYADLHDDLTAETQADVNIAVAFPPPTLDP